MPRGADAENIPPFVPARGVKTRPLSHYPRVSGLVRQRRRHAVKSANASALNISTNTYASEDIPLAFSGSLIVESISPKPSAATTTGLATPPASQITVPTHLPMSPPPEEEIRKHRALSYASTYSPATGNASTVRLQSSTAPVKSRKRARSVAATDEEDMSPKSKSRKQVKAKVVPPMLAGTKRPRRPSSPGVPSFADDLPSMTIPNAKIRKQLRQLLEADTPIRTSASNNVPRTEIFERRKPTSFDVAHRRRRTASPLRIRPLPPPDLQTFQPPPPSSPSEDPLLLKGSKRRRRVRRSDVKYPRPDSPTRASKRVPSSSSVRTSRVPDYNQDMSIGFNDTTEWDDKPTNDYLVALNFNLSSSPQRNPSIKFGSTARLASPYPSSKNARSDPLPVRSPVTEENDFWGITQEMDHGPSSDDSDNEEPVLAPSVPEHPTRVEPLTTPTSPVVISTAGGCTPPPAENVRPRVRAPTPRRKTLSERVAELGTKLGGEGSSFRAPTSFTELNALPSDSVSPFKEDLTPPSDDASVVAEVIMRDQDSGLGLARQDERSVVVEAIDEELPPIKDVVYPLQNNGTATAMSIEQSFDQFVADPPMEQSLNVSQDGPSLLPKDALSTHNCPRSPILKQSTPRTIPSDLPTESSPAPPRFEFQSPTSHMVKPSPFFHQTPIQKQFRQPHQHFDFDFQSPTSSSLCLINIPAITAPSHRQDSFNKGADKTMEVMETFEDDDESSWEGEDENGEPLVHVSSIDPLAAARAAAILKLHHEYIEGSQRKRRRTSSFGSVRKHTPSIRGSPSLLHRVETELATPLKGVAANRSFSSIGNTSIRAVPTTVDFALMTGNETVGELSCDGQEEHVEDEERASEQEDHDLTPPPVSWTKNEWRLLEECFTDVRDDLACTLDVVEVDIDEIDLDEVVQRFVDIDEGRHDMVGDWAWKKIRRRVFALKDRQRSGAARILGSSPAQSLYTPLRTPGTEPQTYVRPLPAPTPTRSNNASASFTTPKLNLATLGPIPIIREIAATPTPASSRVVTIDMPPPSVIPVKATMRPPPSPSPALIPASEPIPTSVPAPTLTRAKPYVIPPSTPLGPSMRDQPSSASKRAWDWMGSFLTRTPQSSAKKPTLNPIKSYPVLPPVSDGDRDALKHIEPASPRSPEKVVHPKDQVQLQHVPTPDSIRPPLKVRLNHKGSSGSVRDLVKGFEGLKEEKQKEEMRKRELAIKGEVAKLKRVGSGGSLRSNVSGYASSTAGDTSADTSREGRNASFNSSYGSSRSFDNSTSWIR